jgi:hypothetical protein
VADLAIADVDVGNGTNGRGAAPDSDRAGTADASATTGAAAPAGGERDVAVTVRNDGTVLSPIRIRIRTTDGRTVDAEAPASVWFDGRRTATVRARVGGDVQTVELDPEDAFADVDSTDDVWNVPRPIPRAGQ